MKSGANKCGTKWKDKPGTLGWHICELEPHTVGNCECACGAQLLETGLRVVNRRMETAREPQGILHADGSKLVGG